MGLRLLPLVIVLGVGCQKPNPTPVGAYQAFAIALRKADTQGAYRALSKETRAAVEARAKAIAEASQGTVKDQPALMLLQSGTLPKAMGDVTVVEEADQVATLEVTSEGTTTRVKMVREDDGRWVVDLSDLFKKQAAP